MYEKRLFFKDLEVQDAMLKKLNPIVESRMLC
jgi:hypothetical protein